MADTLASYRSLFPITRNCHYLNHAAVSPTSTRVRDAVQGWVGDLVNHGMANISDWVRREREIRTLAARILGASPDEITFVRSTSHEGDFIGHAAVSPTSTRVRDAVQGWVGDLVNHGMPNISDWVRREREIRTLAAHPIGNIG